MSRTGLLRRRWCALAVFCFVAQMLALAASASEPAGKKFESLDRKFQKLVDDRSLPGDVILVLKDGKPIYSATHGWADVESQSPMRPDSLFRIASMTKPITSAAILMLADRGKLAVDDPVSKYVPEFDSVRVAVSDKQPVEMVSVSRPVTIHDLLTHTSGIAYDFFAPEFYRDLALEASITNGLTRSPLTVEENVRKIAGLPLLHQPGERFTYGLNTDVLGRVIEVASGKSLDDFFRTEMFEPLKMRDTFFLTPDDRSDRRVVLYNVFPDRAASRAADQLRTDRLITAEDSTPQRFFSGGGGLVSSAPDYARFLQMLLNQGELDGVRLLKPETVTLMTTNHIGELTLGVGDHGDKFGYGVGIWTPAGQKDGRPTVGSYSWSGAFGTYFWVDPEQQLVGVLMVQISGQPAASFRDLLKSHVYDAIAR